MKPDRVLLVDLSPSLNLSDALRRVLNPYFNIVGPIEVQQLERFDPSFIDADFDNTFQRLDPTLIFLTCSRDLLEKSRDFLTAMKRRAEDVPVIAAIESCAPDQAFGFLKHGASDFITSPFHPTDVLPRAWNLLSQH